MRHSISPLKVGRTAIYAGATCALVYAGGARADVSADLVRSESRLKAREMIKAVTAGESLEEGKTEWFPRALALAVMGSVADGLDVEAADISRLWAETARTDQQIGAGAIAPASTTLAEKPGLPRILALGVEHGAIEQESSDTAVVLTTSAYAIIAALEGDSATNYQKYSWWTRLALLGTASLEDTGDSDQTDLDYEDFAQLGVKIRLWGDRSTRTAAFADAWHARFGGLIDKVLEAGGEIDMTVFDAIASDEEDAAYAELVAALEPVVRLGNVSDVEKAFVKEVSRVGATLATKLAASDRDQISVSAREQLTALSQAYGNLMRARTDDVGEVYAEIMRDAAPTVGSLKYTLDRVAGSSDFSEAALHVQHDFSRGNVILNAGVSLYHDPNTALQQNSVRDFSGALTLETSIKNRLLPRVDDRDESPVGVSLSARISRNETIRDEIGTVQAKLTLPVGLGLKLPISLSYANRTLEKDDEDFRIQAGFQINGDNLFDLAGLARF